MKRLKKVKKAGVIFSVLVTLCTFGFLGYKLYKKFTDTSGQAEFEDNEDDYGFDFEAEAEEKMEDKIKIAANKMKSIVS